MKDQIPHIDHSLKQTLSGRQARRYRIIPKNQTETMLEVYIDRTKNINGVLNEMQVVIGKKIEMVPVDSSLIDEALNRNYPVTSLETAGKSIPRHITNKENFILNLVEEALSMGSSDIHFEVQEAASKIRYRIDGCLTDKYSIPRSEYPAVVNAIKIKANLDIAEKRLPQDGRIFINAEEKKLDIRVSVIPTIHGEKIVFRLLNKDTAHIDLEGIGFSPDQLEHYKKGFLRSHGLVLISGPTGSGKTTTLYATLKKLNTTEKNILTIEDPIEYTLEGINQVQLKEGIGLTFPVALRTFLRQDPDIIMVGEIRDPETAAIAIRSALTGHLVLSTIHTNSAWGIISRLTDMGVPAFLISSTLNIAVAQRLVRILCPKCKKISKEYDEMIEKYIPGQRKGSYVPQGCPECNYTGYKGRKAIFEVIEMDHPLKNRIKNQEAGPDNLKQDYHIQSLARQAREVFANGETSFAEILPILLND